MTSPVTIQPIPKTYLDTDTALTANSDVKVATQKAVKAYADTKQSALTKATGAEVDTGTDDAKYVTPKAIEDSSYAKTTAIPVKASGAEVTTGTDDAKFVTAKALTDAGIGAASLNIALADHAFSGITSTLTAGENLVIGDVCYRKSDGKMWKADASVIATSNATSIALGTISAAATGSFGKIGYFRDDSAYNWTVGGLLYLSITAGAISQTAPTATNEVVQILGVAYSADIIYFEPQLVQIELL